MGMTPQYFHAITAILSRYILCFFANYTHHKNLYMHIGPFTPTEWMHNYTPTRHSAHTAHSTAFCMQDNQNVPCPAATTVYNITHISTCHTNTALLMDSTRQTTSAMLSSELQPPTIWLLHSHQHALHTALWATKVASHVLKNFNTGH